MQRVKKALLQRKKGNPINWHRTSLLLALYDVAAVCISFFLALWIRFDCMYNEIPERYMTAFVRFIPMYAVLCIGVFWWQRLYKSMWKFASYVELTRLFIANMITTIVHTVLITVLFIRMPVFYYVCGAGFQVFLTTAVRFAYRLINLLRHRQHVEDTAARVMIIGAGSSGQMIVRDMAEAKELTDKPVCIIDDDAGAWGKFIEGVPIVGGRDEIMSAVKKYRVGKIYLAIPGASVADRRDILHICSETDCVLKQLPGMYQFVDGDKISVRAMKDVSVEDLLGREPIRTDMQEVFEFIRVQYLPVVMPQKSRCFAA